MRRVLSDDTIHSSRENFVPWATGSSKSAQEIFKHYYPNINYLSLQEDKKLNLLFQHFMEQAQKEFLQDLQKRYPTPEFDQFLSDRENIRVFNEHSLNIRRAENEWERNLFQTKRDVMANVLAAYYGAPKVSDINYDGNNERLYFKVSSTYNDFASIVYLDEKSDKARTIYENIQNLQPVVYFQMQDEGLRYIGITALYQDNIYITHDSDENLVRDTYIVAQSSDIDLSSIDTGYRIIRQNITPPSWVYEPSKDPAHLWIYGTGASLDIAKENARVELANSISVEVSSQSQTRVYGDSSSVAREYERLSTQKSQEIVIEDSLFTKHEKKDGYYYVRMQYPKDRIQNQ